MTDHDENINKIKKFSLAMKKNILEMALSAGASSAHFGGALSIVDIVSTLFSYQMKIDKKNALWENRDRFILSKGHACLAYYAALCEIGYISKDELKTFEKDGTNLLGHPVRNMNLGIEFSNGSLGMGLSLAFNGFFNIFGFLFQLFSGTGEEAVISRILQWPWWVITQVTLGVMTVVVIALVFTTRRALRADLAVVLKGE